MVKYIKPRVCGTFFDREHDFGLFLWERLPLRTGYFWSAMLNNHGFYAIIRRMKKLIDNTIPKFLLTGVVNTLVGAAVMFLLYNLAGCSYWLSSAANYLVGGTVSFFLNKYFTFRNTERSWTQVLRFALTVAVCWLIAYGVAKPLMLRLLNGVGEKIQTNAAMVVGMGLYTVLNYLGQRFFAFRTKEPENTDDHVAD